MPESRLVLLADGPTWGPELAHLAARGPESAPRRRTGVVVRTPRFARRAQQAHPVVEQLSSYVAEAAESEDEANAAGEAYERLAALALARKLRDSSPVGRGERAQMLRDAGMPGVFYANPATEAVFAASAEGLGKGGIFGSITGAISGAFNSVSKEVQRIAAPATKIVNAVTSGVSNVVAGGITDVAGTVSKLNDTVAGVTQNLVGKAGSMVEQNSGAIISGVAGSFGIPLGIGSGSGGGGTSVNVSGDASGPPHMTSTGYDQYGDPISTPINPMFIYGGVALVALYLLTQKGRR